MKVNYADIAREKGLVAALQQMRDDAAKAGVPFQTLFGRLEGYKYALQTTGPANAAFNQELQRIRGSAGELDKQFAERAQGFEFQVGRMRAALQNLAISAGNEVLPKLTPVVQLITDKLADPAVIGVIDKQFADLGKFISEAFTPQNIDNAVRLAKDVLPSIRDSVKLTSEVARGAFDFFNSLPPEVKTVAIAALVGNKLTGGLVKSGIVDIAKGLLGMVKAANMNVQAANVNVVGGKGLPGLPGGAGGAAGAAEGAAAGGGAIAAGSLAAGVAGILAMYWLPQMLADPNATGEGRVVNAATGKKQTVADTLGMGGIADWQVRQNYAYGQIGNMMTAQAEAKVGPGSLVGPTPVATRDKGFEVDNAIKQSWKDAAAVMAKGYMTAAQRTAKDFEGALGRVGRLQMNDNRRLVQQQMGAALRIAKGTESSAKKVDQLDAIQRDLLKHGDKWAAEQVGKLKAIAAKKTSFSLNVTEGGTVVNISGLAGGRQTVAVSGGKWSGKTVPLAKGGVMPADGRALVGEAGRPEIVEGIPGGGFRVTPIAAPAGGGAQSVEFHVHVHGANTPGAMREAAQAFGPQLVRWMQQNGFLPRTASGLAG